MRRFSCWLGTSIPERFRSISDIAAAVQALKPPGRWRREVLVKAGEGGSFQARWLHPSWGDDHPLAVDSAAQLHRLWLAGRALRPRLDVAGYVVLRGREEWREAELDQIAACAAACGGRVVLNLEDGDAYWQGPTDKYDLEDLYLNPLEERLAALLPRARLELAAIPRASSINALGGVETFNLWLTLCVSVAWEMYGRMAPDLRVDVAMPRLEGIGVWGDESRETPRRWRRIPIVEKGEIDEWASTPYAQHGLQVWHLDG